MARRKGTPKTGGRTKGTPNKATAEVKEAILRAFELRGGVDELVQLKAEVFYALFGKLVPAELRAQVEHAGTLKVVDFTGERRSEEKP